LKITPHHKLRMGGYIKRGKKAAGVLDDLYARACVLKQDEQILVLILLDLLAVDRELTASIVEALSTPEESWKVIICCTHTHSGPDILNGDCGAVNEYRSFLKKRVVACCREAAAELENFGEIKLFYGERETEHIAASRLAPEQVIDRSCRLLAFRDTGSSEDLGYLANYACHPTILGPDNLFYSGDLFGRAMRMVESDFRTTCILTNGAEGDVSTRFTRKNQKPGEADRLAKLLAGSIEECINGADLLSVRGPVCRTKEVKLPRRDPTTSGDIEAAIEVGRVELRKLQSSAEVPAGKIRERESRLEGLKQRLEEDTSGAETVKVRLMGILIGNIIFIGVPGELTQESAVKIIQNSPPGIEIIFLGLANNYLGYFPTQKLISRGSYEALVSRFDDRATANLEDSIGRLIEEIREEGV
ncbi:MAG: neutral/alkaline non-lysosomal ceramidase N-terminal domain-containing protein, partial [Bacillota bacterium]